MELERVLARPDALLQVRHLTALQGLVGRRLASAAALPLAGAWCADSWGIELTQANASVLKQRHQPRLHCAAVKLVK